MISFATPLLLIVANYLCVLRLIIRMVYLIVANYLCVYQNDVSECRLSPCFARYERQWFLLYDDGHTMQSKYGCKRSPAMLIYVRLISRCISG